MTRTRLYWIAQLGGWALFWGFWIGLASLTGGFVGPRPEWLQLVVAVAIGYAASVGGTHAVHIAATRLGWRDLPLRRFAPRLLVAAFVAAAGAEAAEFVLAYAAEPFVNLAAEGPLPVPDLADYAGSVLLTGAVFSLWATVYALAVTAFRLADAERDRLRLRASLAETRMRALEYQLNPHFLFNALNTVRALVLEDPGEARRAVTLLSGLLRQTLAAGREPLHPLGAELDLVETYLALERLRFDGRLAVRVEADEAARAVAVPTLLVQTLVENAVKHGVARRREGGEVAVVATRDGDRLAVRVENPAAPAAGASVDVASGTGTGLANARERLSLLFGEHAALRLDAGPERAVAEVVLPATVLPTPTAPAFTDA